MPVLGRVGAVVEKALLPMYQEVESVEISTGGGESSGHEQGGPTLEGVTMESYQGV